ncbi:hypothetical protein ZIOFF_070840 [Zingiber officinale]|uniref:CST complex subunit STN1 n=1 Tax=Zingiber officinale TaxID=94328 RepID=A0A8J5EB46_ZINOF|nr:hypothetical protein ZIOFF_070840 [Zingiber officinale]
MSSCHLSIADRLCRVVIPRVLVPSRHLSAADRSRRVVSPLCLCRHVTFQRLLSYVASCPLACFSRCVTSAAADRKGKHVTHAETVGVVVSLDRGDDYITFLVDDGSGCILCFLSLHQRKHDRDFGVATERARMEAVVVDLEKLVRLRGTITLYRGSIQLKVRDVLVETIPT